MEPILCQVHNPALTPFRINTYEKHGGREEGSGFKAHHSFTPSFDGPLTPFASRSYKRPSRKSFPCHSCESMGGCTPSRSAFNEPKASKSANSFRIRSYGQFVS